MELVEDELIFSGLVGMADRVEASARALRLMAWDPGRAVRLLSSVGAGPGEVLAVLRAAGVPLSVGAAECRANGAPNRVLAGVLRERFGLSAPAVAETLGLDWGGR